MVAARCAAKRAPAKARLPSARAACLARAPLRLTDTSGPAQTSETSQTARGLSAPVGGRALGLRSEGSWLAAELLRAGLEPGAVDRRAGWTGFCPSNDQPSPRCAPAVPLPARPACAAARTRTSTLPVPPHHRPICPLVSQLTTPVCPTFVQVSTRAFERWHRELPGPFPREDLAICSVPKTVKFWPGSRSFRGRLAELQPRV